MLKELDFTVIGREGLSRYINQDTLVYAVNMDDRELQMHVDFSWNRDVVPPAAVITQIMNGALDADLSEKYWLTPLLELSLEPPPSVAAPKGRPKRKGSAYSPSLPTIYEDMVDQRESYSRQVLQGYSEQADAKNKAMNTYLSDPMVIMLCRKDRPRPPP
ncbi:hypothetical protein KVR01_001408 [Diaporthe batatas]|uniref:uncharacterized protein n=1 Tax=Diaporthe batatas TaxID=748121 RepID=UPI001D0519FA|nr:uncharacterized protein KVR01_001408 [Diaporthe batatas]KAG8168659.1 hypothetical protein KVR01_001408 [Diaporthe batatas]